MPILYIEIGGNLTSFQYKNNNNIQNLQEMIKKKGGFDSIPTYQIQIKNSKKEIIKANIMISSLVQKGSGSTAQNPLFTEVAPSK